MAMDPKAAVQLLERATKQIAVGTAKKLAEVGEGDRAKHVAQVVHHGEQITLPSEMGILDAIQILMDRNDYLEKTVTIQSVLDVFPFDGALALDRVLNQRFGWSQSTGTEHWWGTQPPSLIEVATGPNTSVRVAWGQFNIPNVEGPISVDMKNVNGRFKFVMTATVKRKDEATVNAVFQAVKLDLQANSIYRGQAIRIRFKDDDGNAIRLPEPVFIDTAGIDEGQLILNQDVDDMVRTNLFTPIERAPDLIANGIPVKRGVLLSGTYGTGKTMTAAVASALAVKAGITYVYVPRADELPEALEFARQYQSPACVVFCEDIDRSTSGERDVEMDDVLNDIDGVDAKTSHIIIVVTSNATESISPAMLRPGRLDAVIEFPLPDAKSVARLLRRYGGDAIADDVNLDEAGVELEGCIPATIAEVIHRAKLAQLRRQARGTMVTALTEQAIVEAARTMRAQNELLARRTAEVDTEEYEPSLRQMLEDAVTAQAGPELAKLSQMLSDFAAKAGIEVRSRIKAKA